MQLLVFLLLCSSGSAISDARVWKPCSFPWQCGCSVAYRDNSLKCVTMENCLNQTGMDALADSINPEVCPIRKLGISCSKAALGRSFEVKRDFFQHSKWRRLEELTFGANVTYVFKDTQILKHLTELRNFEMRYTSVATDLGRLSEILCCSTTLVQLYFKNVESKETKLGRNSFIGFQSLQKVTVNSSPQLLRRIDYQFNTTCSSKSFEFDIYGNLPSENGNFSTIRLTNALNESSMNLGLHGNAHKIHLDAPAHISGFTLLSFTLTNYHLLSVGESPFSTFKLNELQISRCRLDDELLTQLLIAVRQVKEPALFSTLNIQFSPKKTEFPYDDFNNLCKSLTRLRKMSISHSPISFTDKDKVFECPQLRMLCITNCNLKRLPANVFSRLTGLKELKLTRNNLYEFPKEALQQTPKLESLMLDKNAKMDVRANSLRGILPNLRSLDFSYATITEPLVDAFIDQKNLTKLTLVKLQSRVKCAFGKTWFRGCEKLTTLHLSQNRMFSKEMCHAYGFFAPLKNLHLLDLHNCGFGQQTAGVIKILLINLTSLDTLRLTGNNIYNVEYILSARMPNLTHLHLSENPFSGLSPDLLVSRTPNLKELSLASTPIVNLDPAAFNRMPDLRVHLGGNQFACSCDLMPFTDWMRQQYPLYMIEARGDWLSNAMCDKMPNRSHPKNNVRLLDFRLSWWDCYSRRLIVTLSSTIGGLMIVFLVVCLVLRYRWKLRYTVLAFCIRHGLVKRKSQSKWEYDACFIYDESDSAVSEWVEALVAKLETDLKLRLYEAERDAPVGSNMLDEAASAIDKSRHAVLVLSRGFLENRLNLYSAQWSNESLFMRRRTLAVLVMREKLRESDLRLPGCKVLHRLYRMCKRDRVVDCSGCGVGGNSANRLGLLLYDGGAGRAGQRRDGDSEMEPADWAAETEPLLSDD